MEAVRIGTRNPTHELSRVQSCRKRGLFMSVEDVLKKLREEVAECRALSNIATDPEKRKLFETVAERLTELASAVGSELAVVPADVMRAVGQTKVTVVADSAEPAVIQTKRSH